MHMKSKKFTALCLCAVLLGSMAFTACKKAEPASATADEAITTIASEATTRATTQAPTATQAETEPFTTEAPKTEPATKAPSKQTSASGNNSGSSSGNATSKPGNSSNSNSNSSSNNNSNNSGSAENKPVTCIITVDGKDHKVQLDDTLTYTCYLKTPNKIENVQATLNYPGTTLELLDTVLVADPEDTSNVSPEELQKVFPVLKSSVIYNGLNHNIIKFNASNISGFDFTKGDYLIKLRFKVISGINGAVSTKIEFMDEVGGNPYVDDFKFTNGIEFKEELKQ